MSAQIATLDSSKNSLMLEDFDGWWGLARAKAVYL